MTFCRKFLELKGGFIMKKLLSISLVGIACIVISASVRAATPEQIEAAIDHGIAWIAPQQQADGRWAFGGSYTDVATTGLVLVKLCDRAYELDLDPFDNSPASPAYFPYADNVIKGFDFLLAQANFDTVGVSSYGYVYSTGISMMAVAASNVPDRIVTAGPLAGQTYKQVLQGMMDWMADAQNDSDCGIGGWGYTANEQYWADNSNSGYATIGIGFAGTPAYEFKIPVPPSVVLGLDAFIANIQVTSGPLTGGSIYNPCYANWVNILKAGNLLYQLALAGHPKNDPRVLSAVGFIETYWNNIAGVYDGGGWIGDYQAMFLMKKGFVAYGDAFDTINVTGNPVDWFDEVSTYIVNNQHPSGYWQGTAGETSYSTIDTAWALLTLEPTVPPPPLYNPLNLTKSDGLNEGQCINAGDKLTYEICFDNATNNKPVNNVALVDTIPADTFFVSATGGGVYDPLNDTITWEVGTLPAEAPPQCFQMDVTISPILVGTTIENQVTISSDETNPTQVSEKTEICPNRPPECAEAYADPGYLWPPNHKMVPVNIMGVTDPDGDGITIIIDSIYQDEPVDTYGDGQFTPDGQGGGTDTVEVRAERSGTLKVPGDGRVYHISFTADDGRGGVCTGEVLVGVPHDVKDTPVDGGALYDSTALSP